MQNQLKKKNLLLVDGHAVAFHCWYTSDPPTAYDDFQYMVDEAIDRNEADHLVVAFDPPPPTFRHHLWPSYKEGRPPVPDQFLEDCERVKQKLDENGTLHVTIKGYEADDVIGTLAAMAEVQNFTNTIFTVDLDLLQLASEDTGIEVFSQYRELRFFDSERVSARFHGLIPSQIPNYKALVGDVSDNLPGVPGIGEVTAGRLFEGRQTLEEIYEDLDDISSANFRGSERCVTLLAKYHSQAMLMRKLTTIVRDLDIPVDFRKSAI